MEQMTLIEHDMGDLSPVEAGRLAELEQIVSAGLMTFYEVGAALQTIRNQRLYRATHSAFDSYCRDKWGMSKAHANRLIVSAEVVAELAPIGATPENESQARALAEIDDPEERKRVWVDVNKAGKATASAIRAKKQERGLITHLPHLPAVLTGWAWQMKEENGSWIRLFVDSGPATGWYNAYNGMPAAYDALREAEDIARGLPRDVPGDWWHWHQRAAALGLKLEKNTTSPAYPYRLTAGDRPIPCNSWDDVHWRVLDAEQHSAHQAKPFALPVDLYNRLVAHGFQLNDQMWDDEQHETVYMLTSQQGEPYENNIEGLHALLVRLDADKKTERAAAAGQQTDAPQARTTSAALSSEQRGMIERAQSLGLVAEPHADGLLVYRPEEKDQVDMGIIGALVWSDVAHWLDTYQAPQRRAAGVESFAPQARTAFLSRIDETFSTLPDDALELLTMAVLSPNERAEGVSPIQRLWEWAWLNDTDRSRIVELLNVNEGA